MYVLLKGIASTEGAVVTYRAY